MGLLDRFREIFKSAGSNEGSIVSPVLWRPEDTYVPMGTSDVAKIPILPMHFKFMYDLYYYSDVLRTVIRALVWEVFRNGLEVRRKFAQKCLNCGAEFDDYVDTCEYCGSDKFREPNWRERNKLLKILSDCNLNDQALVDVLKDVATDVAVCYTPEHEILTKSGWKKIGDITYEDEILSIDPKTGKCKYVKPVDIQKIWFDGELIVYEGDTMSFRVTPDHLLVVVERGREYKGVKRIRADQMFGKKSFKTPKYIDWEGEDVKFIEIDEYNAGKYATKDKRVFPKKRVDAEMLARFIGWYISEGCILKVNKGRYNAVRIGQSEVKNKEKVDRIVKIIKELGYEPRIYEDKRTGVLEIRVDDTQLATWIAHNFGEYWYGKRLPIWFKNLSKRILRAFLEEAVLGDGNISKSKTMVYSTANKELADDIFEVALKAGYVVSMSEEINQKSGNKMYKIFIWVRKRYSTFSGKWKKEKYTGYVYDVTLPENHIMLVRRNGDVFWGSNCDNGFLIVIKKYMFDKDGNLVGAEPIEVIRGSPLKMRLVMSKDGRMGVTDDGRVVAICLNHRDRHKLLTQEEMKTAKCEICGCKLFPAYYKMESGNRSIYYTDGEVLHFKLFTTGIGYGHSPILSIWIKVMILMKMDWFVLMAYHLQRPPKALLILRGNRESLAKAWEWLVEQARVHPHMISPLIVEGGGEAGARRVAEFIDLTVKSQDIEFISYRDELRKAIGAIYGVMPLWMGDTRGGLANEGLQITVTNRAIEMWHTVFNDKVLPWLVRQLGIGDWEIRLRPHELRDEMSKLELAIRKTQLAQAVRALGYKPILVESKEGIDYKFEERDAEEELRELLEEIVRATGAKVSVDELMQIIMQRLQGQEVGQVTGGEQEGLLGTVGELLEQVGEGGGETVSNIPSNEMARAEGEPEAMRPRRTAQRVEGEPQMPRR